MAGSLDTTEAEVVEKGEASYWTYFKIKGYICITYDWTTETNAWNGGLLLERRISGMI